MGKTGVLQSPIRLMEEERSMKCICCGKEFKAGNDRFGIPNGFGLEFGGKIYEVCSDCITYRNETVVRIIQECEKERKR